MSEETGVWGGQHRGGGNSEGLSDGYDEHFTKMQKCKVISSLRSFYYTISPSALAEF